MRLSSRISIAISLIFFIAIFGMAIATADTASGILNTTNNNHTVQEKYLINVSKTTMGWPFLKKDLHNSLGVLVSDGYWDGNSWSVRYQAISLSSLRANGSEDKAYGIKSQTLRLKGTPNDRYWAIKQHYGNYVLTMGSWPHEPYNGGEYTGSRGDLNDQLIRATINGTESSVPFPLSASGLTDNLTKGVDTQAHAGPEEMEERKEKTKEWGWHYSAWPWGDKSDCAAVVTWESEISPGDTFEFDVIDETCWGLFDSSESVVHVKVTAPPNPGDMSKTELKAHDITGLGPDDNNFEGKVSYLGYGADNLSVEMS